MVSLCLTKPRIDGRVTVAESSYVDARQFNDGFSHEQWVDQKEKKRKLKRRPTRENSASTLPLNSSYNSVKTVNSLKQDKSGSQPNRLQAPVSFQLSQANHSSSRNNLENFRRKKMLATVRAMGDSQHKRLSSRNEKRFAMNYVQSMPDARKDPYSVHKWRLKSGRSMEANSFADRTVLQLQQRILNMKNERQKILKNAKKTINYRKIEPRYLQKTISQGAVLHGKEKLFGVPETKKRDPEQGRSHKLAMHLPHLRNQMLTWDSLPFHSLKGNKEDSSSSPNHAISRSSTILTHLNAMNSDQRVNILPNIGSCRRATLTLASSNEVLPPIVSRKRRHSYPVKQRSLQSQYRVKQPHRRKTSLIPSSSPMAIPENEVLQQSTGMSFTKQSTTPDLIVEKHDKLDDLEYKGEISNNNSEIDLFICIVK